MLQAEHATPVFQRALFWVSDPEKGFCAMIIKGVAPSQIPH